MKYLFIPDLYKYEEEFALEANSIDDAIKILSEECPYNCVYSVFAFEQYALRVGRITPTFKFIGCLEVCEWKEPEWVTDDYIERLLG